MTWLTVGDVERYEFVKVHGPLLLYVLNCYVGGDYRWVWIMDTATGRLAWNLAEDGTGVPVTVRAAKSLATRMAKKLLSAEYTRGELER